MSQNVGIKDSPVPPHRSAILDVNADSLGMLLPRTDTSAVMDPANGLILYDSISASYYYFNGLEWIRLLKESDFEYFWADRDGDGYGDKYNAVYTLNEPQGYVPDSTDCNDHDPSSFPEGEEVCDGVDNDCNGQVDEGVSCAPFEHCFEGSCQPCCHNPGGDSCQVATVLGGVCGDLAPQNIDTSGCGDGWYGFSLVECSEALISLQVVITLVVPDSMDYDLYLYNASCGTVLASSAHISGIDEEVTYLVTDVPFIMDAVELYIWVKHYEGSACDEWQLSIRGGY